METKYTELLSASEQLNKELATKCESFDVLDEKYRSLIDAEDRAKQLKSDLKDLLDAKISVEQTHSKTKEENKVLRGRIMEAQKSSDALRCVIQKQEGEIRTRTEESKEMFKKNALLQHAVSAMTKAEAAFVKALDCGENLNVRV